MIGERKSLQEIVDTLSGFEKVLVLACGTCVTVCMTGGDKEARALIIDRLTQLNQLHLFERIIPIRDWSADRSGGSRKLVHRDQ